MGKILFRLLLSHLIIPGFIIISTIQASAQNTKEKIIYTKFIAQEVEKAAKESMFDFRSKNRLLV